MTGLPNTAVDDSPNTPYNDEKPIDLLGNLLPLDPFGGDFEGLVVDPADGSFWMVDEYRPAIYHFATDGLLINRFVPIGTAAAAGQPAGTFGAEALPAVLAQRRQNRGFEAIAYDGGKIYAFVQSPLRNPASLGNPALNAMTNIRVVEFDPATLATRQFIYVMDNPDLGANQTVVPTNSVMPSRLETASFSSSSGTTMPCREMIRRKLKRRSIDSISLARRMCRVSREPSARPAKPSINSPSRNLSPMASGPSRKSFMWT